jgi:hypothetical protein
MKKSTLLIIREMQIKTKMRCHLTLVKKAYYRRARANELWGGWGEKGTPVPCWWEYTLAQPLWQSSVKVPQKTKNGTLA